MIHVFILTYSGMDYFPKWFNRKNYNDEVKFYIIDNGNQNIHESVSDLLIYRTNRNIGCAGGWNLMSSMAYEYYHLDKFIIGQDDAQFTQKMLEELWNNTDSNTIAGAYDRSFEFAMFGLDKTYYNEVGPFDENFIFAGCEDNDYKHRAKLMNKRVISLNYSADMNLSLSTKRNSEFLKESAKYNVIYTHLKWGNTYEFTCPFNNPLIDTKYPPLQNGILDVYGVDTTEFPSKKEYQLFLESKNETT